MVVECTTTTTSSPSSPATPPADPGDEDSLCSVSEDGALRQWRLRSLDPEGHNTSGDASSVRKLRLPTLTRVSELGQKLQQQRKQRITQT